MIRMKIHDEGLRKLIRDLKRMRFDILRQTSEYIIDLSDSLNQSYTHSIDELVYEEYTPEKYERTMHLRGAHGALIQETKLAGDQKSLKFYINEDSVDPVDGETWRTKADNVEHGSTKMTVGFDRPFIDATQEKLEWETGRMADALIRKFEQIIKRVGG